MKQLISKQVEETLGVHDIDLDLLVRTTDVIEHFFMGEEMGIDAHILKITKGKYSHKSDLGFRYKRAIELADLENTILDIFPDLWEELGEAIRNLIISNYRSVSRSLRWIIESIVFWADVELDKKINDAISHSNDYYQNLSMAKENYSFQSEYILHYNRDHLDDRLYLKERDGKPGFGESVNSLNPLKRDGIISQVTKIQKELKALYHDFSAFTHISVESLRRGWENPEYYPYSMEYSYNAEKFHSTLKKLWNVIDLVAALMLLMCSRFYGYILPNEYLKASKTYYEKRKSNATNKFIKHMNSTRNRIPTIFSLI